MRRGISGTNHRAQSHPQSACQFNVILFSHIAG